MVAKAFNRTWAQLFHPTFRSIFFMSVMVAIVTLSALTALMITFWPADLTSGIDKLDTAGMFIAIPISWYLLFPSISTTVSGLFLDKIARTVETEDYPNRIAERRIPVAETVLSALRLSFIIILVNLVALIPYIILFFLSAGIASLALYLLINGYLLGREYFEMVASRHMPYKAVTELRRAQKHQVLMAGMGVAGLYLIPIVNLAAPIIGAAVMTHIFHLNGAKADQVKARATRAFDMEQEGISR